MNPLVVLGIIRDGWHIEERALEGTPLPPIEMAHQAYVTGILSGLLVAGTITQEEFDVFARQEFERRDVEMRGRN